MGLRDDAVHYRREAVACAAEVDQLIAYRPRGYRRKVENLLRTRDLWIMLADEIDSYLGYDDAEAVVSLDNHQPLF